MKIDDAKLLKDIQNSGIQPLKPTVKKVITEESLPTSKSEQMLSQVEKKIFTDAASRVDVYR